MLSAVRLYGVLGGGRYRGVYVALFAVTGVAAALLWDENDWDAPGLVATLVATILAVEYIGRRYAAPGNLAWGIGSFAPLALSAVLRRRG